MRSEIGRRTASGVVGGSAGRPPAACWRRAVGAAPVPGDGGGRGADEALRDAVPGAREAGLADNRRARRTRCRRCSFPNVCPPASRRVSDRLHGTHSGYSTQAIASLGGLTLLSVRSESKKLSQSRRPGRWRACTTARCGSRRARAGGTRRAVRITTSPRGRYRADQSNRGGDGGDGGDGERFGELAYGRPSELASERETPAPQRPPRRRSRT